MKLLVHLHLYYHNQVDYFIEKLSNIEGCDWDLYVTYVEENPKTFEKIKNLKPEAKFFKVKNIGYDVWPFIQVLRDINLSDYDYILKLHTKNQCKINFSQYKFIGKFQEYQWRNELIKPLIGSRSIFRKNLNYMKKPDTGIIASKLLTLKAITMRKEETDLLDNLLIRLNIKSDNRYFVAGTMFIIKSDALRILKYSDICEKDFISIVMKTGGGGTIAHALERIFITLALENNLKVYKIQNYPLYLKFLSEKFVKNIFSLVNSNDKRHKILTIFGIKLAFKR